MKNSWPHLGRNFLNTSDGTFRRRLPNEQVRFEVKVVVFAEIAYSEFLPNSHRVPIVAQRYIFRQTTVEGDARWQSDVGGFSGQSQ